MRPAVTFGAAAIAALALPAAAGAATERGSVYSVVKASGSERLTFSEDLASCTRFHTCHNAGSVSYRFGGTPSGRLVMQDRRGGTVSGLASFKARGTTSAKLAGDKPCSDTVRRRHETFALSSRTRSGRLLFGLHGTKLDFLGSHCATPSEVELAADGALPHGSFKRSAFGSERTSFRLSGSALFREHGYRGRVRWSLSYRLERMRCSPNCRVPAQTG